MTPHYKFFVEGQEIDSPCSAKDAIGCMNHYKGSDCQLFQMIDVSGAQGGHAGFEYVKIASREGDGTENWINLFFNGEIVALITSDTLATQLKKAIPERRTTDENHFRRK